MKLKLQAYILILLGCLCVSSLAQETPVKLSGKYQVVKVSESKFKSGLEMLGREQNEYATHLTVRALNNIIEQKGNQASLTEARKYIGLALHLSPKNRDAVIANIQLSKGIFPKNVKKGYTKAQLSTLLLARAGIQKNFEGETNLLLAQCFTQLAADLDPHKEEAVYQAAIMEQDHGAINWSQFTTGK